MSKNQMRSLGVVMGVIGIISMLLLGGGALVLYYSYLHEPATVDEESVRTIFVYRDISEIPNGTDVNDTPTTEDLEEEDLLEEPPEEEEPPPEEDEEPPPEDEPEPSPPDYSFSGEVTFSASFLDRQGNPLVIIQSLVKQMNGEEIDGFKLVLFWDYDLGKDLKPETLQTHFEARMTTHYEGYFDGGSYRSYNDGDLYAGRIFNTWNYGDKKGRLTNIWGTDYGQSLSGLKWDEFEIISQGSDLAITTTEDTFTVTWTATVATKSGVTKLIKGSFGIRLFFFYDYHAPDLPPNGNGNGNGGFDPPLISIAGYDKRRMIEFIPL